MTYRTFRRRLSEATAAHDWLEGLAFVLGLAFLVLAVVCVWGIVTSDREHRRRRGARRGRPSRSGSSR